VLAGVVMRGQIIDRFPLHISYTLGESGCIKCNTRCAKRNHSSYWYRTVRNPKAAGGTEFATSIRRVPVVFALLGLSPLAIEAQKGANLIEYLGGPDSSHYSPLKQANKSNVDS
jgi:hypothetical protein